LVAHWSFDDGTADDVASGINGTFQRGATTVSEGKVQALRLERADSEYVDIPHSDSLMIESGITIAAWVKYTGVYSGVWGNRFIYKYGWDTGHTGPHLMVPAGGGLLEFSFNTGNLLNPYVVTSTQNYNDDQWHLVVATYDGSFSSLYVDGELEDQIPASGNINYLHPFQILLPSIYNPPHLGNSIGRNGDEDNRWFDGLIDEVRVWSRAYPIEDVESLYLSEVRYF